MAEGRSQDRTPRKIIQSGDPTTPGLVGRPPLFGSALSPNSLVKRSNIGSKKRKISKMRSEVSKNYWQSARRSQEEENDDDLIDVDEDGRIIELDRDGVDNHGDNEEVVDENQNFEVSRQPVTSTLWRNKKKVEEFLEDFNTAFQVDILNRLVYVWHKSGKLKEKEFDFKVVITDSRKFLDFSKLSSRTTNRKAQKLYNLLLTFKHPTEVIHSIFSDFLSEETQLLMFKVAGLDFHDSIKPRLLFIKETFEILSQQMTSMFGTSQEKLLRAKVAIQVVEKCGLSLGTKGDIAKLSLDLSCSPAYSKKFLTFIQDGTPEKLFKREVYNNAVKAIDWPEKLRECVILPENSRPVPGKDTISIRRGCRVPKYILKRNKLELIKSFLEQNPNCL